MIRQTGFVLAVTRVVALGVFITIAGGLTVNAAESAEPVAPPPEADAKSPNAPVTLSAPVLPAAPPKQMEVDVPATRAKYPNLLNIRHFSTVDVVILGNKSRLGLKENELQDFGTYCFGQLFKGYDLQPLPARLLEGTSEYGTLNITVNMYALGVSCELRMGTVGSATTWVTNELRVSTTNGVKDARLLKTTVAQMMAKAAYTLRKTQGR